MLEQSADRKFKTTQNMVRFIAQFKNQLTYNDIYDLIYKYPQKNANCKTRGNHITRKISVQIFNVYQCF